MQHNTTRDYWRDVLGRVAGPVLSALAEGRLRASLPIEAHPGSADRNRYTHLEAFARTLVGIAPWLELGANATPEGEQRGAWGELARAALRQATDPASPDVLNFHHGMQPIVDLGFLAQAIVRAPQTLWASLDETAKANLVAALQAGRTRKPPFNNWLLFSAMAEAALHSIGHPWDPMRVDYALRQHEHWYLGDGVYGDGPEFHWDYYNSFVIQPMLVDIARCLEGEADWAGLDGPILERARRWAEIQERMISPEGTFPPIGRSLCYRMGALQGLGQMALLRQLPASVAPAAARCALTTVMRRMIEAPGTFDDQGWLRIGFCGAQPGLGETYISTGSLYLCSAGLLPLGLSPDDPFWTLPDQPWTSQRLWNGDDARADKSLKAAR